MLPLSSHSMIRGYLATDGFGVCELRICNSLRWACPTGCDTRRSNTVSHVNPVCYDAKYFGRKCHFDQNEKLIHYGATHVVGRDGF